MIVVSYKLWEHITYTSVFAIQRVTSECTRGLDYCTCGMSMLALHN